jgi:menaquinone-dependent protoporphyrinogen oxidase
MRVLICYATTEGQTRKIAEFVAGMVKEAGHEPAVFDATVVSELEADRSEAAILTGSVHIGRYQSALVHRIHQWRDALNAMPSAFISVSMAAASDDPHARAEVDELCQKMLQAAGWTPTMTLHAAGAIRFSQYDFFKRLAMRLIARQMGRDSDPHVDHEYTDWDSVRRFAEAFLANLRGRPG